MSLKDRAITAYQDRKAQEAVEAVLESQEQRQQIVTFCVEKFRIIISVRCAVAIIAGVCRGCRREREAERLQRLNAWQQWPAPQSAAELEHQVAGSRDAREWARRNPELAQELDEVLAGHE